MSKYENLATDIIKNVGGEKNINQLTHCVTRLRFNLYDESIANDEKLKNLDGVVTVLHTAGQYQIVIGNHVGDVFAEIIKIANIKTDSTTIHKSQSDNRSLKDKFLDLITGILVPSVTMLCACGMIKGVNTLLSFLGVYSTGDGLYSLLNAIGDSIYYFFPIVIGYNMAKKLNMNLYLGLIIGASLCYPAINGVDLSIFGLHVNATYTGTILPVILIIGLAKPIETFFNKIIPSVVKSFLTPMLTLMIVVPIGFVVIGPIANTIATFMTEIIISIYEFSPIVTGLVLGGTWMVLVIMGFHIVISTVFVLNVIAGVADPILPMFSFVSFTQTGVALAVWLKTKDIQLKGISFSGVISGIFGITEPIIYGIMIPKKLFVSSLVACGITGALTAMFNILCYTMGGAGIFMFPAFIDPMDPSKSLFKSILVAILAFVVGLAITLFVYKEKKGEALGQKADEKTLDGKKEIILSPLRGVVKELSEISDDAFSQGVLGKGVMIQPTDGNVFSPCNGTIKTLFPTKHAIGIISDSGCEILIHVGINTVHLNGKYFEAHVKQGDRVNVGELLMTFDKEKIEEEGYCLDTPVIITNTNDYIDIIEFEINKEISTDDTLLVALI
ncbi:beta-glucoside-specific PTS transporter subunit IIABC [Dielma fastidiosa]|uniref:Beta-glucoside-specific PTS transporter subunit IIABC n=1 Tax=Dielma fastidiosa TaxID=1034346 RepID=A0AB35UIP8_9FIRM|nr:beta-glucoside-specific PTS transporter subunit IIABC [Dielma fastidiosa]MDY5167655.1 beta-glucoside-specific PTS transporter subunit IIABC [Dielma fastidiosa]